MKVIIHGPNLLDQSKGSFHVHSARCRYNAHYGPGTVHGGDSSFPPVRVRSTDDVVYAVYEDHIEDEDDLDLYRADIHFAPCVSTLERTPNV